MERLPHQFKLTISRQVGDDTSDIAQPLCLIQEELKIRKNCLTIDNSFTTNLKDSYKGGTKFDSTYTFAGLHVSHQASKIACKTHWKKLDRSVPSCN